MISICDSLCIGCGACVRDCPSLNLTIKDRKAMLLSQICLECGHCAAICPVNAFSINGYDMADVVPCIKEAPRPTSKEFLYLVKERRSIRSYKDIPLSKEQIHMLIEAGRYTATACNRQSTRFILVQDKLSELRDLVYHYIEETLKTASLESDIQRYRPFLNRYRKDPEDDYLFRNAPAALFLVTDYSIDAGMAAQNIEHMARSLGLGCMYNGLLARIIKGDALTSFLQTDQRTVATAMLLGTPAVSYHRTAPRKPADCILL